MAVINLSSYDKASPDWPVGLSLNAVLSIASTAFRASLLFAVAKTLGPAGWIWYARKPRSLRDHTWYDAASRGPLGSIQLLWQLSFQPASLGAVVTLLSLGLDPVFQQTIVYENRLDINPGLTAQAVAATFFNGPTIANDSRVSSVAMPFNMLAAKYMGTFSGNLLAVPDPPFSCPSGNCTWDPLSTLAFNTVCEDLTPYVELNCTTRGEYPGCNFVARHDKNLRELLHGSTRQDYLLMQTGHVSNFLPALDPFKNITGALSVTQWVKLTNFEEIRRNTYRRDLGGYLTPNAAYEAGRCLVYLSVQQISARAVSGQYEEDVLQESYHAVEFPASIAYHWNDISFSFRDPFKEDDGLVFSPPFAPGINFTVPADQFLIFTHVLASSDVMNGTVRSGFSQELGGPQALVWELRPFVAVRWTWLAPPAVLLGLGVAFFAMIVLESRRRSLGLWTTSPFALYFQTMRRQAPDGDTFWSAKSVDMMDGMEDLAHRMEASVVKDHVGGIEVSRR